MWLCFQYVGLASRRYRIHITRAADRIARQLTRVVVGKRYFLGKDACLVTFPEICYAASLLWLLLLLLLNLDS